MGGLDAMISGMGRDLKIQIHGDAGLHGPLDCFGVREVKADLAAVLPFGAVRRVVNLENKLRARWNITSDARGEIHRRCTLERNRPPFRIPRRVLPESDRRQEGK